MNKVAEFKKVSLEQYLKDSGTASDYMNIRFPKRATSGSAGYDIFSPFDFVLKPGESITVPTGLRVKIDEGWLLMIYPKSGLGTKFRLQLNNTCGLIDSDYFNADNEGHILVSVINDTRDGKTVEIAAGKAFVQAVFVPFGITFDDEACESRRGGFGSTGA